MRSTLATLVALLLVVPLTASARPAASPTVAACAQKDARLPGRKNHTLNVMDCLTPRSIVVNGTLSWSDCASAPPGDECDIGTITTTFRSTASGFKLAPGLVQPEPWGGWQIGGYPGKQIVEPYWAAAGLPGTGTFRCKAEALDRITQTTALNYETTMPLRDQGVAFTIVKGAIRVSSSMFPGYHSRYGHNPDRLFGTSACQLPVFRPRYEAAQHWWPGRVVPVGSLVGASPVVTLGGTQRTTIPAPNASWFGTTIVLTYRWSATLALRPRV